MALNASLRLMGSWEPMTAARAGAGRKSGTETVRVVFLLLSVGWGDGERGKRVGKKALMTVVTSAFLAMSDPSGR